MFGVKYIFSNVFGMILLHAMEVVVCYDPDVYDNTFRVDARLPQHVNEVKRNVMFLLKYVLSL